MADRRTKILIKLVPCLVAAAFALPISGSQAAHGSDHDREARKKELQEALAPVLARLKGPEDRREHALAFNEGWRWVYWRKAMTMLKDGLYKKDALDMEGLKTELNLSSTDEAELMKEARGLAKSLREKGEIPRAAALESLLDFVETENDPASLERLVSEGNDDGLKALALFILGGYYEKMGFHPEASGYYSRLLRVRKDGFLHNAAHFRRSRILFFEGKYEKAREGFRESLDGGFTQSELLLAYTYLIRGEFANAGDFFEANRKGPEEMDPVSLSGLAEMDIEKKNYAEARKTFDILASLHSKDPFLSAYFSVRKGDAFVIEGLSAEGERAYVNTRDSKAEGKPPAGEGGEPAAMANLALADLCASRGDADSLAMAERIYRSIAYGGYIGSEITLLRLIEVETRLGKYEEALEDVLKFTKKYPASAYKQDLKLLNGNLIYQWIEHLSEKNDSYGLAEVNSMYGSAVPFGKKAGTYLKAGKAYIEIGLESEAASALDSAIKIGSDSMLEEAIAILGRVYYGQKDYASVERLLGPFAARFPKSPYMKEVEPVLLKASYMLGNHAKAAALHPGEDLDAMVFKAKALSALKRNREAAELFAKAAEALAARGEDASAAKAWIGAGDAQFAGAAYAGAVDCYGKALALLGDTKGGDRSWALYRTALASSRLKKAGKAQEALRELKGEQDDIARWADTLLKESM